VGSEKRLWSVFERWCLDRKLVSLPATEETVAAWLADRPLKEASVQAYGWAIRKTHLEAGHRDPTATWPGASLARRRWVAKIRRLPVLTRALRALPVGGDDRSVRGRALVLLGYCAGLDLDETRLLSWDQIEFRSSGLVVATETGPAVVGRGLVADSDPVRAMVDWMMLTGCGCVFPDPRRGSGTRHRPLSHAGVRRMLRELGGRGFSAALAGGIANDALRVGLPDDVVLRHIRRDDDVARRFDDALVRHVGL
jgi:integrase